MTQHPAERKVNFFIVGEPKSGTTALAQFLSEHPQVGFSHPKEPDYFATDIRAECDAFHSGKHPYFPIRTPEQYLHGFAHCGNKPIWGEGSTLYLNSKEAAANIRAYNPDARIIIMLRNPVDFMHSLHMQMVNISTEDEPDFETALAKEPARRAGRELHGGTRCPSDLFYAERAHYTPQIERFLEIFPREQVLLLIAEEFQRDNAGVYKQVLEFIGADADFRPAEFRRVYESRAPRSRRLHRQLNNIKLKTTMLRLVGPDGYEKLKAAGSKLMLREQARKALDPDLRQQLLHTYQPEVRRLAQLIRRPDLPELWGYDTGYREDSVARTAVGSYTRG